MKLNRQVQIAIIVLLCALFVIIRLWNVTANCLWFDEIFSVHAATHDWTNLFWFVAQDLIHPPLFYVLLKIWILMGGDGLLWLRFFPVFFSIISLVPFFLLCRELKLNFLAIALSLLFFAVNGCLIKYAQEVRMYSLFLCLSLFSVWLFVRYFNFGKNFWILTVINILLVYTHYFGWLFVLSQISTILIFQNIKIRQMMIMLGLMMIGFAPWALAIWEAAKLNSNFSQNLGWMDKPDFIIVFQFIFALIEPFFYQQTSLDPSSNYLITIPILFISATLFVFYFVTNWSKSDEIEKRKFFLLLILFTLPILSALTASWVLPYSIWGARHLIIIFPPLYLLLAVAISSIQLQSVKIAGIILIILMICAGFLLEINRQTTKFVLCGFQELVLQLPQTDEKTTIYVFEDDAAYHIWFALRKSKENFQVVKINGIEGLTEDKAYFLPRGFDEVKKTDQNGIEGKHFWVAFRDGSWNKFKPPLRNLIAENYRIGEPKIIELQGLKAFLVEVWKE